MDLNIFLPEDLSASNNSYSIGYVIKISDNLWGIFILKDHREINILQSEIQSRFGDLNVTENNVLHCDILLDNFEGVQTDHVDNYLRVHVTNGKYSIRNLVIAKNTLNIKTDIRKSIFLLYNRSEFLTTEVLFSNRNPKQKSNEHIDSNSNLNQFYILKNLLSKETSTKNISKSEKVQNNIFRIYFLYSLIEFITGYSRLFLHILNISKFISQIFFSIWKERKVSMDRFHNILFLE